jgi:uncharacterized membrane protein YgaE (UPF0421/DUF939 family)
MNHGTVTEEMPASCSEVFDLLHDYDRRLTGEDVRPSFPAVIRLVVSMLVGALIGSIFTPQTSAFPYEQTIWLFLNPLTGAFLAGIGWSVFVNTVFPPPKR